MVHDMHMPLHLITYTYHPSTISSSINTTIQHNTPTVYQSNLFQEDGQTNGIIGHAGQLSCTLPEQLNVSLLVKPTFKVHFLFTHPLGKVTNNCCCCYLTDGPLPILWVTPYHAATAAAAVDRTMNCYCCCQCLVAGPLPIC